MSVGAAGLSINLYLAERSWRGLVVADASSHNAKVLSAPRTKLQALLEREELGRSGIYVLTGPSSGENYGIEGYVGESDSLVARLKSHAKSKPFWSRAYVAVAKDAWLSKSHVRYLEAEILKQARSAPLVTRIANDRQDLKYDRLPDGERVNLEEFLAFLRLVMPAIGCPLYAFQEFAPAVAPAADQLMLAPAGISVRFEMKKGNARAVAYLKDGSFWVCRGSTARIDEQSSLREGYRRTRRTLVERGVLVADHRRSLYVFAQDVPFNSPSDAASVVGTTSLNGRKEWRVIGAGMSFGAWEGEQDSDARH